MKHLWSLQWLRQCTQHAPLPMAQLLPFLPAHLSTVPFHTFLLLSKLNTSVFIQEELEKPRIETAHDMLATQVTGQGTHKVLCPLLFLSMRQTVATQTCLGRESHSHKGSGFPPSTLKSSRAHCQTEPLSSPMRSVCP